MPCLLLHRYNPIYNSVEQHSNRWTIQLSVQALPRYSFGVSFIALEEKPMALKPHLWGWQGAIETLSPNHFVGIMSLERWTLSINLHARWRFATPKPRFTQKLHLPQLTQTNHSTWNTNSWSNIIIIQQYLAHHNKQYCIGNLWIDVLIKHDHFRTPHNFANPSDIARAALHRTHCQSLHVPCYRSPSSLELLRRGWISCW